MVVAMMFPLILAQARTIALSSAWRRRHWAVGWFLAAYFTVWLLATICCELLALSWARFGAGKKSPMGASFAAAIFALACVWQFTPIKRRAATRCHRRTPLPMSGWRADVACLRYGIRNGVDCIINCWPAMLVLIMVPHSLGLMALVTSFILADRYLRPVQKSFVPLAYTAVATGCVLGCFVNY
jgi:predicted metal-binding membrane protein